MANNVNTNLAAKLFAYIQHKDDINSDIKKVYGNSMIFIGDEQQILIPKYNAYVGIGMTSYNNTVNRIAGIETDIADLKKELGTNSVKSISVQWHQYTDGSGVNDNINAWDQTTTPGSSGFVYRPLSGDITIAGLNDYNEATHFAYNGVSYAYNHVTGEWGFTGEEGALINATSGITLTYVYEERNETTDEGITITKPVKNRILIDDKKTWAYMTSAYTYSLEFSRDYTNARIETLYHDILGLGENVLVPVKGSEIVIWNNQTSANELAPGNYYYWVGTGDPVMPASSVLTSPDWADSNPSWTKVTVLPTDLNASYYSLSTTYNNTYSMNITDGIQTLKEVAYILDQLTDGGLGEVTYLNITDWGTATSGGTEIKNGDDVVAIEVDGTTYYRIITGGGHPTTNQKKYGYWVNENPSENIGIQMAASIAGNTMDINDLHDHVEFIEAGNSTVRSLSVSNINNNLVTMTQVSNLSYQEYHSSDTYNHLPNETYMVGDTRLYTRLDLASTYIAFNNEITLDSTITLSDEQVTDLSRFGALEQIDFTAPEVKPTFNGDKKVPAAPTGTAYYLRQGDTFTKLETNAINWVSNFDEAILKHDIYWFNPTSVENSYLYANQRFTAVDYTYVVNNPSMTFYTQTAGKFTIDANHNDSSKQYYINDDTVTLSTYMQHAVVENANHIATTTWTMAYVRDTQGALDDKIGNILQKAKDYTDDQIKSLDTDTLFSKSEFYTYWAQNNPYYVENDSTLGAAERKPGTTAYTDEEATRYDAWKTFVSGLNIYPSNAIDATRTDTYFTMAYANNKARSQYVMSIVEEDGIVSTTTKELPTDVIEISNSMWNSQQNGAQYTALTLGDAINTNHTDDAAAENTEKLFAAIYDQTNGKNKDVYVKYTTGGDTDKAYVKVPVPQNAAIVSGTYYVMNNNGQFVAATNEQVRAFWQKDTTSVYYTQLYTAEDAMYEVIISSINGTLVTNSTNGMDNVIATADIWRNGVKTTVEITANGTATNLYVLSSSENKKTQYITGSVQHYDYTVEGGQGQNKINLDVNITRIEDATADNTGFADAWDVQNYIENMFTWVDISASVTDAQLETGDRFYTTFSTVSGSTEAATAKIAGVKLYTKSGSNYIVVFDGTSFTSGYAIAELAKDINNNIVDAANSEAAVSGSNFFAVAYGDSPNKDMCVTYTTTQTAFINPLNMKLTVLAPTA